MQPMLGPPLSLALRCFFKAFVLGIAVFASNHASQAQEAVDVLAYFDRAQDARGAGLAHKTKPVDVRSAKPGAVVLTTIKGEGKIASRKACSRSGRGVDREMRAAIFAGRTGPDTAVAVHAAGLYP
jgi:hypothetical protein